MTTFERTTDHHVDHYQVRDTLDELVKVYEQACNRRDWAFCDRLHTQIASLLGATR